MRVLVLLILLSFSNSFLLAQNYPSDFESLDSLWFLYEDEYEFEKAIPYAKRAVAAAKSEFGAEDTTYLLVLNSLTVLMMANSINDETIEQAKAVVEESRVLKSEEGRAAYSTALSNLATVYLDLNTFEEAILLFEESLEIQEKIYGIESLDYSTTLNNLAMAYSDIGRKEEGLALQEKSLSIKRKFLEGEDLELLVDLDNLALSAAELSQYEKTDQLYKEIMDIWEDNEQIVSPDFAIIFNNMGYIYDVRKEFEKAERYYKRSVDMQRELVGEDHPEYAFSLSNYAVFQTLENKDYAKGLSLYKEIRLIFKKAYGPKHPAYIHATANLSALNLDLQNFDRCFELAHEGICQLAGIEMNPQNAYPQILGLIQDQEFNNFDDALNLFLTIADMYGERYDLKKKTSDLEHQEEILYAIMQHADKIQQSFANEEDKLNVLNYITEIAATSIKNIHRFQLANPEAGKLETAFQLMERNKSALLTEAVGSDAFRSEEIPEVIQLEEQAFRKKLSSLRGQLGQARSSKQKEKVEQLQKALLEQYEKQAAFLERLQKEYPEYAALKYKQQAELDLETAKAQLLREDNALLSYFIYGNDFWLFFLSKEQNQLIKLELDATTFEAKLADLHESLTNYSLVADPKNKQKYLESAHFFYQKLLAPAKKFLEKKQSLIIIPDGLIGQLPFETFLKNPGDLDQAFSELDYLLKDFDISYSYSAKLLAQSKKINHQQHSGELLAVAANYTGAEDAATERSARALMLRKALQPLPAARAEVEMLAKAFNATALLDTSASESNFKKQAKNAQIIHLAMHGLLNERNPLLSSLAFTENGDSLEDNFLEVHEISNLDLQADLVVLSACETGYGKFRQGEGMMSLARSFMYAGVPSLVVSLWQVNDASTALIMKGFYTHLDAGMDKAAALRQAKLDYIQKAAESNPIAAHPAFWAPFIQLGDSRSIKLSNSASSSNNWIWALIAITLSLTVLSFLFLGKKRKKD